MPVTTKQIAELAGVSRGTVDRALNGRDGISEETRQKVLEIANRLGYVPNRAGKALSGARRTVEIGLVLNCADNPFYDEVIRGIETCRATYPDFNLNYRYRRLKGYSAAEQLEALDSLSGCQILLVTPLNEAAVAERIDLLSANGVTVVTLNSDLEYSRRTFHVGCDYPGSGRTAAGLMGLLSGGQGQVGIVTGSLRMLGHRQRVDGFLSVLATDFPQMEHVWLVENNDDDQRSRELVLRQMERFPHTTAVYFGAAGISGGASALAEWRPDSIPLIVTCDDIPATRDLIHSGIVAATVCQEPFRQGFEAVRIALEYKITGIAPEHSALLMKNEIKIIHNMD